MNLSHGEESQEISENTERMQEVNRIYNKHFHDIHRADERDISSFVYDDINQIFYPKQTGTVARLKEKSILSIFEAFTKVIPYDQKKHDMIMQYIIHNPKNTVIDTNHATFANIPIEVKEINAYANKLNHKEKIDAIYTILAPSLTTQSQRYLINSISHLLKTFTLNPRSQIEGLKDEIKKVRSDFKKEIDFHAQQQGKIFMLASGGTRDVLQRNSYGEMEKIYMEKNRNVRATNKLLRTFVEQGDTLILQGMNEAGMKRPDKTNPKDHTWTKGNTYVDTEILSPEDALHAIENNTILERIAALTRDMYGRQVGQVVSSEEMKKIKYIMETDPKQTQFYPKQDFDDTLGKATVRGLFHILNTFI